MTSQFDPTEAVSATHDGVGFMRTAGWATALEGGRQLFTLLVGFVLARMLGPDAFGVLAMALVYIAFLEMVQRQGLIGAVIQRPNLDTNHANAAFWLVMAASTFLTVVSIALAGWWADVNRTPELRGVIIALSLTLPLQGLNVVQEALLRRQMRFRDLTIRTTSAVVVGGVAGVGGALAGWDVWALVAQQLVTVAWSTAALWVVSGWRPGLRFTGQSVRDLLGFSTGTFLSSLGLFLGSRADVLISGFFLGPVTVGLYRFAARLVDSVISLSGQSAQSMALPELSALQGEQQELTGRARRLSKMAGALALPVLGVMFGAADVIIATLGPEWTAATYGLRWMCLYGVARTLVTLNGPIPSSPWTHLPPSRVLLEHDCCKCLRLHGRGFERRVRRRVGTGGRYLGQSSHRFRHCPARHASGHHGARSGHWSRLGVESVRDEHGWWSRWRRDCGRPYVGPSCS